MIIIPKEDTYRGKIIPLDEENFILLELIKENVGYEIWEALLETQKVKIQYKIDSNYNSELEFKLKWKWEKYY